MLSHLRLLPLLLTASALAADFYVAPTGTDSAPGTEQNDDVRLLHRTFEEVPPRALPLDDADEPNHAGIRLFHCVVAQANLRGKHVLEVSCGQGGSASFRARTLHAAS
jgi:hypothetical protein